jgi:hypothetical protein
MGFADAPFEIQDGDDGGVVSIGLHSEPSVAAVICPSPAMEWHRLASMPADLMPMQLAVVLLG